MTALRALALLTGSAACLFRVLSLERLENDHFIYIARGANVLAGDWPIRDFEDPGGVLMTLASASAAALATAPIAAEVALSAAAIGVAAAATAIAAARLSGSMPLGLWAAVVEVAVMPRLYAYPKLLLYALASWGFVSYARTPDVRRAAALGLLAGVGFLLRHDHAVYLTVGAAALFGVAPGLARERVRGALSYSAAAVVAVLPFLVYVEYHRGLTVYLNSALRFAVSEARRAGGWSGEVPPIVVGLIAIPPIALAVAAYVRRQSDDSAAAAALAVAVMLAAMEAGFIRDQPGVRAADVIAPAAILAAWLVGLGIRRIKPRAIGAAVACVSAILFTSLAARHGGVLDELFDTRVLAGPGVFLDHLTHRLDSLRESPPRTHAPSPELAAVADYIDRCTGTAERVLVGWFAPELPVMSRRLFGGGHAALVPGYYTSAADQRLIIERLGRGTFVILSEREREGFERSWPALARHLATEYAPAGTIRTAGVEVLAPRERRPAGYDPATGLPCFR